MRLVQPGCVVYDLGANAGFFTLLAARLVGPSGLVVAVEPNPRNVADLRKHLALNGVGHVRLVEAAVGATDGAARFSAPGHPSMGRLTADGPLMVRVVPLDALGLPAPSVIKCDVEGGEVAMLRGARRLLTDARRVILLETHGTAATDACRAILAEHGYSMTERAHSRYLAAPY